MNVTLSLLFQLEVKVYWFYVTSHAIHLINKLPTNVLKEKSLYKIMFKEPPYVCFASLKRYVT